MDHKPKNLLFDLGNVIVDIDIPSAEKKLQGLIRNDVERKDIEKTFIDYECGRISTDIFINRLLKVSNPKVQAVDVVEAWTSMLIGIPSYRIEMLRQLRDNFNVYLLSNTNELHLEWIHRHLERMHGVTKFEKEIFHEAFYSHLVGDRKPLESIFQHVIDETYLTPANTLFIDDIEENILTGKKMGFQTYWLKDGEEVAEYLKVQGYY